MKVFAIHLCIISALALPFGGCGTKAPKIPELTNDNPARDPTNNHSQHEWSAITGYEVSLLLPQNGTEFELTSSPQRGQVYFFDSKTGLVMYLPQTSGIDTLNFKAKVNGVFVVDSITVTNQLDDFNGEWDLTDSQFWQMSTLYTEDKLNDPKVIKDCIPSTLNITQTAINLSVAKPNFQCSGNPILSLLDEAHSGTISGNQLKNGSGTTIGYFGAGFSFYANTAMGSSDLSLLPIVGSRGEFLFSTYNESEFTSGHLTTLGAITHQNGKRVTNKAILAAGPVYPGAMPPIGVSLGSYSAAPKTTLNLTVQNFGNLAASFDFSPKLKDSSYATSTQISDWNVDFKGGAFPGQGSTCSTTLTAGASCDLVVEGDTSQVGRANVTIQLPFRDDNGIGLFETTLYVNVTP